MRDISELLKEYSTNKGIACNYEEAKQLIEFFMLHAASFVCLANEDDEDVFIIRRTTERCVSIK